jgi:hypothetical protein
MSQRDQESWKSKLTPELIEFAGSDAEDQRLSILIELDIPPSRVNFSSERIWQGGPPRPKSLEDERPQEIDAVIATATNDLQGIISESPHWIGAAKAFVANVSPSELCRVAALPSVRRVRLNRRLR